MPKLPWRLILVILLFIPTGWLLKNHYLLQSVKNSTSSQEPSDSTFTKLLRPSKPAEGDLAKLKLPEGFSISYFAKDVPGARSLAVGEKGIVYVGTRDKTVYAIIDSNQDGVSEKIVKVASNLDTPNGVAMLSFLVSTAG